MGYESKVFNVMIASPGDVASERTIIRDVIYEWNAVNSQRRNIVLLPVGWETHSSPEMGQSPQDIINDQVLERCDLLVGVFWTRIGTPTSEYASGTVEEIEKHMSLGKPTMLYFSSQPAALDDVDNEQYSQLKQFKKSCQSRGLYESYDSHSGFRDKFYRQLQLKINDHPILQVEGVKQENQIIESSSRLPDISGEARILLKEASQDKNGTIMHLRHLGGTDIQTNGKNFIESNERREVARWEAAIEELCYNELLVERGHKGEIYEISNQGYQVADMIQL
ncbi:DUF4062 domain-containing protein [Chromohalobacter japonicus]|uniref:DUF4062 domain-containing protein n=1 Tax=Chromohalobacter japonicus TaxID=223900 RepID=UPI0005906A87|nr:DUF4062 domain-containing protein [Chromohalobacter japonicus]